MTRPMTDAEKQMRPVQRMAENLYNRINFQVTPDWRLVGIHRAARELAEAINRVDLSGPPKPVIPVDAYEVEREYVSPRGFPTTQLKVKDDWDGVPKWD